MDSDQETFSTTQDDEEETNETDTGRQKKIDTFAELNRYPNRDKQYPSTEVFTHPLRTTKNGWKKFHATNECGREVYYMESPTNGSLGEKWEFQLYCHHCGHKVNESNVLFIGGDWWSENGWEYYEGMLGNLFLPEERIIDLGPDPDREEVEHALTISRIEQEASSQILGFGLHSDDEQITETCDECDQPTALTFDSRCRLCYTGVWTDSLQHTVDTLGREIKEQINNSHKHKIHSKVDPTHTGSAIPGELLWRKQTSTNEPKVIEIKRRFKDTQTGEFVYLVTGKTDNWEQLYDTETIVDSFYDTGLNTRYDHPEQDWELIPSKYR